MNFFALTTLAIALWAYILWHIFLRREQGGWSLLGWADSQYGSQQGSPGGTGHDSDK